MYQQFANNHHSARRPVLSVLLLILLAGAVLLLNGCTELTPKPTQTNAKTKTVKVKEKVRRITPAADVRKDFDQAVLLLQHDKSRTTTRQAVKLLNAVIAREKRLPAPYINLAIAYERLKDAKQAENKLISALKLEIGNPVANNELGLLYRKAGRFKAARVAYKNAIHAHPDYLPAKRNLGVLCDLYLHDYGCALQQFEDYIDIKPDKKIAIWVADLKQRLHK